MRYYVSLQYSAIQKTVLRHDRLWSIAGISQGLAKLNEVTLPRIIKKDHQGTVLVAGGGKCTAVFDDKDVGATEPAKARSESARRAIEKEIATTFPMLEFQISEAVDAETFSEAKSKGIIDGLNEGKRIFRGYATTFLPHLAVCGECGEYPAEKDCKYIKYKNNDAREVFLCRTCHEARNRVWTNLETIGKKSSEALTTLERIYAGYLHEVPAAAQCALALDFSDLFPSNDAEEKEKRRLAVWFSDLNNMNKKVPIWLSQNENKIFDIFAKVKDVNIAVVVQALKDTFPKSAPKPVPKPAISLLPFRIIVAGGDDLCIVMPEEYILNFAKHLDNAVTVKVAELDQDKQDNPLKTQWLQENAKPDEHGKKPEIKPYSFGGAFVVTSLHTPFRHIHQIGDDLMKEAKKDTDRWGNSVNWRIMAEENAVNDKLLKFERRLFVNKPDKLPDGWDNRLTFDQYLNLCKAFGEISSSHRFSIIERLIKYKDDPERFTVEVKKLDGATRNKSFSGLFSDAKLINDGNLVPARIATLFELLSIKSGEVLS